MAVLDDDIAEKLNIDDETRVLMREISNEGRQAQRQAARQQQQNGPQFQTAEGRFDREAAQAYRETPEGKAATEKQQQQRDKMQSQTIAQIGRLLTKNQKSKFLALQGKEFDLSKLTNDPNAAPPAAAATTTKAAAKTAVPLFVTFLAAVIGAFAAFFVWIELLVRDAAVYVVALFAPMSLAASIWPRWSGAFRRSAEVLCVVIVSKFVIVAIIGLAAGLAADSGGSVARACRGRIREAAVPGHRMSNRAARSLG